MTRDAKPIVYACSFCGIPESRVRLVHGPRGVCICDACIRTAIDILGGHVVPASPKVRRTWRPRKDVIARWKARGLPPLDGVL